ncbi:MAG TPA: hypothetical protein VHX63_09205, partial [Acidobacteriaceae bacterium]|nr:hypothetical protein [Acidobacteriaceae bacterium]
LITMLHCSNRAKPEIRCNRNLYLFEPSVLSLFAQNPTNRLLKSERLRYFAIGHDPIFELDRPAL